MSKAYNETEKTEALRDVIGDDLAYSILQLMVEGDEEYTISELEDRVDMSSATVYRKFDDLIETDLVNESVDLQNPGATCYSANENAEDILEFVEHFYDNTTEM